MAPIAFSATRGMSISLLGDKNVLGRDRSILGTLGILTESKAATMKQTNQSRTKRLSMNRRPSASILPAVGKMNRAVQFKLIATVVGLALGSSLAAQDAPKVLAG